MYANIFQSAYYKNKEILKSDPNSKDIQFDQICLKSFVKTFPTTFLKSIAPADRIAKIVSDQRTGLCICQSSLRNRRVIGVGGSVTLAYTGILVS